MTPTQRTSTETGNITFDDVKKALGDTNPNDSSANALRAVLGRGSLNTIQKHLHALRAAHNQYSPVSKSELPTAPPEAMATLWFAACSFARAETLARLETVSAERDAKVADLVLATRDLSNLGENYDQLDGKLQDALGVIASQKASLESSHNNANTSVANLSSALAEAMSQIEHLKESAAHASALFALEAKLKDQSHATAINHLTDELANAKSLLIARTSTSA